ncbi:MAG TPA: ATP-binding cassette domain-containing protein [Anaerolineaceae bacterium]|nr:ATP-binding cassette domain-containing protein [Anaerolineaceae bacterium]HQN05171.1 ATP-binding cassette domain-containing protein [Anaerolineaceae bacterium]
MKISFQHINKWFGKVHANDDINFTIPSGTIQGILGENGAGKSTLMKVLTGFYQADSGEIYLDDKAVTISSPEDAVMMGIGMLHQDPLDFPPMKVIDNFLLGTRGGLFPNRKQVEKDITRLSQEFDFQINPDSFVETLTVGERQQLEILRLLWLGVKVLILDEPTTGISANQKEKLFATLLKLASQGLTVIFVSHKLEEVEQLCSRVAVFRQGQLVGEVMPPYDTDQFVYMMFGKSVEVADKSTFRSEVPYIKLENISLEDYRLRLRDINLEINCGEVIGLAGMEGSGQRLFLRMLTGLIRPVGGSILYGGHNFTGRTYPAFQKAGVAYLPAARLEEGLIPGMTLTEHFILSEEHHELFVNQKSAIDLTEDRIREFYIKGTPASQIEQLSGGNQQRALLALLRNKLRLILMEHPTRGLDIESAIWIWSKMKERCKECTSIVFTSSDLDEIIQYSDRILVFFGGLVSKPIDANTTSVDELGQLIGGKGW